VITHGHSALFELLQPLPDAFHTRNRKTFPPDSICHPHTRVHLIDKVLCWVNNNDGNPIFWLQGSVGSGKSAIAQTIAENFESLGQLGGSFFFFRGSNERGKILRLVPSLAYQLSRSLAGVGPIIEQALRRDPTLLSPSVSVGVQLQTLVLQPYRVACMTSTSTPTHFLFVIDGLDECSDHEETAEFINVFLTFARDHPDVPLRLFISSRVERHIHNCLKRSYVTLENLKSYSSHQDITLFMRTSFAQAARTDRVVGSYGQWPSEGDIERLAEHADGSFIFASTIVKFILGPAKDGLTPIDRLPLALNLNPGLDGLYMETLSRSENLPHFRQVMAHLVLLSEPQSIEWLSSVVGIKAYQISHILVDLQAILHVPGDDYTPVSFFHTSVVEFLQDPLRSGRFYVPSTALDQHYNRLLSLVESTPSSFNILKCVALELKSGEAVVSVVAKLLELSDNDVLLVLFQLGGILGITREWEWALEDDFALHDFFTIKPWHTTFNTFFADSRRSGRFSYSSADHEMLARRWVEVFVEARSIGKWTTNRFNTPKKVLSHFRSLVRERVCGGQDPCIHSSTIITYLEGAYPGLFDLVGSAYVLLEDCSRQHKMSAFPLPVIILHPDVSPLNFITIISIFHTLRMPSDDWLMEMRSPLLLARPSLLSEHRHIQLMSLSLRSFFSQSPLVTRPENRTEALCCCFHQLERALGWLQGGIGHQSTLEQTVTNVVLIPISAFSHSALR